MKRHRILTTALAGLTLAIAPATILHAQEEPTFSVDVEVVNILATVRDRDGGIVSDLAQEDFILTENGEPQEIRYFTRQTDLPLTIGLLIDTSMSQWRVIDSQKRASYQFFEQVLRPEKDLAFVIKFDVEVELLQDLTGSRPLLQRALDDIYVPSVFPSRLTSSTQMNWQGLPGGMNLPDIFGGGRRGGSGGGRSGEPGGPGPPGSRGPRGTGGSGGGKGGSGIGTTLYDSVFLAADELLASQAGRKTIILISDGVDHGSKVSMGDSVRAAQRADTIVYSIRYYDTEANIMGRRGRRGPMGRMGSRGADVLEAMSVETGGRMYEVVDGLSIERIFELIQEELRNQYSIGYTPSAESKDDFREIELKTKDKKLKVQTREGYYSKSP